MYLNWKQLLGCGVLDFFQRFLQWHAFLLQFDDILSVQKICSGIVQAPNPSLLNSYLIALAAHDYNLYHKCQSHTFMPYQFSKKLHMTPLELRNLVCGMGTCSTCSWLWSYWNKNFICCTMSFPLVYGKFRGPKYSWFSNIRGCCLQCR